MKKILFLSLVIALLSTYAHAQRKIQYGFNMGGGLGIQDIDNSGVISNSAIRTFNAEAVVYIPVLKKYYVRTGLAYENKGTTIVEDALTTTNKISYIELPFTLTRKYEIPTLGKLIGGVGGYFAMGDNGTITYETPNSINSNYITFGDDQDFLKYDAGIKVIAGLELNNRLTFNLAYDFGLSNIASQSLKDAGYNSIYNRQFLITLGLLF
jgi:hypothetical protein